MKNQSPKINNKFEDVTQTEKVKTITNTKMSTTIPGSAAAATGVTKVNKNNQGFTKAVLDPDTQEWRILQPSCGEEQVKQPQLRIVPENKNLSVNVVRAVSC